MIFPEYETKSMADLETEYKSYLRSHDAAAYDFGPWLPDLAAHVRPLVPGELVFIMSDTGVGKTAILCNLGYHAQNKNVLLFELELPGTLCFERLLAMHANIEQMQVEFSYKLKEEQLDFEGLDHIRVCDASGLTIGEMGEIMQHERIDNMRKYDLVLVDYIGLMACNKGRSRYERVSENAEQLKVFAKKHNVVVVAATQIHRKGEDYEYDIHLHDARDAGAIENSCGLLLGVWREPEAKDVMKIKVLKNTKGSAGHIIDAQFDGSKMKITPIPRAVI